MKALATADIHIDINNRIEDTKSTLTNIAKYVILNKIEIVYVIGDIYERKRPYNSEKAIFEKWAKFLSDKKVQLVIVAGNHDTDKDNVSAVEEFAILKLPYIEVKSNPCLVTLGDHKIFLGHFLVNGAKLGSHEFVAEASITVKSILDNYEADLYLLGDVHKQQLLHEKPDMLYVGAPRRINFGERDETPTFVVLETTPELSYSHIEVKDRPMYQFEAKSVLDLIQRPYPNLEGAIVKIVIACSKEEYNQIDEAEIRTNFKEVQSLKIEYDIIREDRVRNIDITENCTTVQAFQSYAEFVELDEEVVKLGLAIINTKED